MVLHGPPSHGGRLAGTYPSERGIFHGRRGQHRHVPCRGVVSLRIQSIGIGEAGIVHSQCGRLLVHQRHERLQSSGALRQSQRRVIAGAQQQPVQQLLPPHRLSDAEIHGRALRHVLRSHGHSVIQRPLLQRHQRRHDLGGAGNTHLPRTGLVIQDLPRVRVHQNSGRGGDLQSLRHNRQHTQ